MYEQSVRILNEQVLRREQRTPLLSHEDRLRLIHRPFPIIRIAAPCAHAAGHGRWSGNGDQEE